MLRVLVGLCVALFEVLGLSSGAFARSEALLVEAEGLPEEGFGTGQVASVEDDAGWGSEGKATPIWTSPTSKRGIGCVRR